MYDVIELNRRIRVQELTGHCFAASIIQALKKERDIRTRNTTLGTFVLPPVCERHNQKKVTKEVTRKRPMRRSTEHTPQPKSSDRVGGESPKSNQVTALRKCMRLA